ncbi:hypothetical protein J8273_5674 [Carpediemonas membranifera]|uniref:TmcB/TmcC TPR repeats domain-containing protein n=1 Tax=Carpediemonas membranifera TaxID=201153 RepID=A0A8J6DZ03_9EUKA|nr:hypothetical protein J8273_5674 [Carpediemonas membranifera]|eukprot:KAG9392964.1 hypothetical protein J8273_5674 [Carpediemonas membranifera]
MLLMLFIQAYQLSTITMTFSDTLWYRVIRCLLPTVGGLFTDKTVVQVSFIVVVIIVLLVCSWTAMEMIVLARTIRQGFRYRMLGYVLQLINGVFLIPIVQVLSLPLVFGDDGNEEMRGLVSAVSLFSVQHTAFIVVAVATLVVLSVLGAFTRLVFFSSPYDDSSVLFMAMPTAFIPVQLILLVGLAVVASTGVFGLGELVYWAPAVVLTVLSGLMAAAVLVAPLFAHPVTYTLSVATYIAAAVSAGATVSHPAAVFVGFPVGLALAALAVGVRLAIVVARLKPLMYHMQDPTGSMAALDFEVEAIPMPRGVNRFDFTLFVWFQVWHHNLFAADLRRQTDRREMLAASAMREDEAHKQREMIGRLQSLVSFACAEAFTSGRARLTIVQYALTVSANYEAAIFEATRVPMMVERDIIKHLSIVTIMMLVGLHSDADTVRHKQDSGLNAEALAQLNHKQKKAKEEAKESRRAINSFWRALDQGKPDVNELLAISQEIHKHSTSADKLYIQLIKAFPERDNIIRAYADFVTVVQQDPEYGALINACAEEIANQRMASDTSSNSASSSRSGSQASMSSRALENDVLTVIRTHSQATTSLSVSKLRRAVLLLLCVITAIFLVVGLVFQLRMFILDSLLTALAASGRMDFYTAEATYLALLTHVEEDYPGQFTHGMLTTDDIIHDRLQQAIDLLETSTHALDTAASSAITASIFGEIFEHARQPSFLARYYLDTAPMTTQTVAASVVSVAAALGVSFLRIHEDMPLATDEDFIIANGLASLRNGIDLLQIEIEDATTTAQYVGLGIDFIALAVVVLVLLGLQFFLLRRAFNTVTLHQAENINVFLHIDKAIVRDMIKTTNVVEKRRKKKKKGPARRAISFEPQAAQAEVSDTDSPHTGVRVIEDIDGPTLSLRRESLDDEIPDDTDTDGDGHVHVVIEDDRDALEDEHLAALEEELASDARQLHMMRSVRQKDGHESVSGSESSASSDTDGAAESSEDEADLEYRLNQVKAVHRSLFRVARPVFLGTLALLITALTLAGTVAVSLVYDALTIPELTESFEDVGSIEHLIEDLVTLSDQRSFSALEFVEASSVGVYDAYWDIDDNRRIAAIAEELVGYHIDETNLNTVGAVWDLADKIAYREKVELALMWANLTLSDAVGCQIIDFEYNYTDETWFGEEDASYGTERATNGFYSTNAEDAASPLTLADKARAVAMDTLYWEQKSVVVNSLETVRADVLEQIEATGAETRDKLDYLFYGRMAVMVLFDAVVVFTVVLLFSLVVLKAAMRRLADKIDDIRHRVIRSQSKSVASFKRATAVGHVVVLAASTVVLVIAVGGATYTLFLLNASVDSQCDLLLDRARISGVMLDFNAAVDAYVAGARKFTQRPSISFLTDLEDDLYAMNAALASVVGSMAAEYTFSDATVTGLTASLGTLNDTVLIATQLVFWANNVPSTVATEFQGIEYDITAENTYDYDQIHYTRPYCYTNSTYDATLDAETQTAIARAILFDEKFADLQTAFHEGIVAFENEALDQIDSGIDADTYRGDISLIAAVGCFIVIVVVLGALGIVLLSVSPAPARKLSVIRQRLHAKATQRFYRMAAATLVMLGLIFFCLTVYSELWLPVGMHVGLLDTASGRCVHTIDAVAEALFVGIERNAATQHYIAAAANLEEMQELHDKITSEASIFMSAINLFLPDSVALSNTASSCDNCTVVKAQAYEQLVEMFIAAVPELNPANGDGTCLASGGTSSPALAAVLEIEQQLTPIFLETFESYADALSTAMTAYRLINVPLLLFALGFLLLSYRLVFRRIFVALSRDESIVLSLLVMIPKEHVANNMMLATFIAEHAIDN